MPPLQLLIKQALKNTSANSPVPETEPKGQKPTGRGHLNALKRIRKYSTEVPSLMQATLTKAEQGLRTVLDMGQRMGRKTAGPLGASS